MAKEYIERGALLNYPIRRDNYDRKNGNIHFINGIESILEYAESLPTADVQEVRHGKWELLDECANEGVYCSICHKKVYKVKYANQKVKSNYCPNYGAKMDKE